MEKFSMKMFIVLATVWFVATLATAQPHRGDILLSLDGANKIKTGAIRLDGTLDINVRVFSTTLGIVAPNFTSNPGFDSQPGTFPVGTRNGFHIRKALRAWDGSAFSPAPPFTMNIAFATLSVDSPITDFLVPGFDLSVGSNGQWHKHLSYTLAHPASDGLYLLELELYSTSASITMSDPYWMIFNQNRPAAETAAAWIWVQDNLVNPTDPPCAADFNRDGGIDGQDVEAFFLAWSAGEAIADVNEDGGIDGQDVEYFFVRWEQGGC